MAYLGFYASCPPSEYAAMDPTDSDVYVREVEQLVDAHIELQITLAKIAGSGKMVMLG